jgi:hypothetical protein
VVAADVANVDADAAEVELETVVEDDVGGRDPNVTRRRQLRLDVFGVLPRALACCDAAVERLVAPVGRG